MNSYKFIFFCSLVILILSLNGCGNRIHNEDTPPGTGTADNNSGNNTDDNSGLTPSDKDKDSGGTPSDKDTPTPSETPDPPAAGSDTLENDSSYETKASELVSQMSLEEKAGQMFFVRLRKASGLSDIKDYHLGGYVLFGDDFKDETKSSIKKLLNSYQKASSIPMFIGVDEEGGTVNRVSRYPAFRSTPFQSPMDLYKKGGFDGIQADTKEKADLLLGLGINVNLAPVCDVSTSSNDFIYKRSFGKDEKATIRYVRTVVSEMSKNKLGSVLKHFPGYGNNPDTHTGVATDTRKYEQFVENDFLPFQAGIKAGADSILVSHNIVTSMDKDHPASLSPAVHDILRDTLGFEGVIMTDDLSMEAIKNYSSNEDSAVLAIKAGNDLLVATDFDTQIPAVIATLKKGTLKEEQIDKSVTRILLWKLKLGILSGDE